jgi:hypothetical protein
MIEVLRLLHETAQANSRYSRSYYVRHLYETEPIPQFGHGIPDSPLAQRDWVWVASDYSTDKPIAILVAAPMQGIAYLMRLYAINSSPKSVLIGLFRKVLADICLRGYTRFAVCLSSNRKEELKLRDIIIKGGGKVEEANLTLFSGYTDIGGL